MSFPGSRVVGLFAQALIVLVALGIAAVLVVPRLVGWEVLTVLTGSMAPTYPANTVLTVEPVDVDDIEIGDVIAFRAGETGRPVTHRVVAITLEDEEIAFVTKGDANEDTDPDTVKEGAVHGRVVFGVVGLGRFMRVLRSPVGFGVLAMSMALLYGGDHLTSLLRRRRPAVAGDEAVADPAAEPELGRPDIPFDAARRLLLATVRVDRTTRAEVLALANLPGVSVVEAAASYIVFAAIVTPDGGVDLESVLCQYDLVDVQRSAVLTPSLRAVLVGRPILASSAVTGVAR